MSFAKYDAYKDSGAEWLSEVPSHWRSASLRHVVAACFNGLTEAQTEPSERTVPVTRIETISRGSIDLDKVGYIDRSGARADRLILNGDIIFSNINSLNMIGNCAQYYGEYNIYAGMNLLVLRPSQDMNQKWLYWLIRSSIFRQEVESLSKPAINQASISQTSLMAITVPIPSINEQSTIATFLDRETAKIDALIAEQERLIALLKEKRQAVISAAVTGKIDVRGLAPASAQAA